MLSICFRKVMDFYPGSEYEFANLPRETQVIWLAMEGNTDKTIAQLLEITTDTVATYWKRILVRYDSSSRTEVIAEFLREYYEDDLDRLDLKISELEEKVRAKSASEQHQLLATAQLNSLMNLLDVGVLFTNNGLKVSYINEQMCAMAKCELTPKELMGKDISTFLESCQARAVKSEESTARRIRSLASSSTEKTVDQLVMTDGRVLLRTFCNVMLRGSAIGHFIVYKDVTNFVVENRLLQERSKLSEQFILRSLVHLETSHGRQAKEIVNTLSCVAKIIGADRAMIGEIDSRRGVFSVVCEWAKNEFDSPSDMDQSIPLTFVDWFRKQMADGDFWIVDSVDKLPRSASMERSIFTESKTRSAVALNFQGANESLKYFVQFSSVKESRWDRTVVESLQPLQKILSALFRKGSLKIAESVE